MDHKEQDRPALTDVVITPAMIDAGVAAYMSWDHDDDPAEVVIRDVFQRMMEASREYAAEVI